MRTTLPCFFRRPRMLPHHSRASVVMWLELTTHRQKWLFSSTLTYHSADLLTARGVAHLVVHGTDGSTSYETIPPVRLETSRRAVDCGRVGATTWWPSPAMWRRRVYSSVAGMQLQLSAVFLTGHCRRHRSTFHLSGCLVKTPPNPRPWLHHIQE